MAAATAIGASSRGFFIPGLIVGLHGQDDPARSADRGGTGRLWLVYPFPAGKGMGLTGVANVDLDPPRIGFSVTAGPSFARHTKVEPQRATRMNSKMTTPAPGPSWIPPSPRPGAAITACARGLALGVLSLVNAGVLLGLRHECAAAT